MKFKDIRNLIYCPCTLIIGRDKVEVQTHSTTEYDNYEVIGIRSQLGKILISLKR